MSNNYEIRAKKRLSSSELQIDRALNVYEENKANYFTKNFYKAVTELSCEDVDVSLKKKETQTISKIEQAKSTTFAIDTRLSDEEEIKIIKP